MSEWGAEPSPEAGRWRAGVVRDFAQSELFDRTFQEGMALVEETATYLDGSGRQESKSLDRRAALGSDLVAIHFDPRVDRGGVDELLLGEQAFQRFCTQGRFGWQMRMEFLMDMRDCL